MIKKASVQEINELISSGSECQIIDVRELPEFDAERIEAAELMPLSRFERLAHSIDHSKPVYLMCRSGNRARTAAERLTKQGFTDVHVIEGGMVAWAKAELPVIKGESKVWPLERQVRLTAGALVLTGFVLSFLIHPYAIFLSAFIGAGLVFSAVTDTCGMGTVLTKMPWNRGRD